MDEVEQRQEVRRPEGGDMSGPRNWRRVFGGRSARWVTSSTLPPAVSRFQTLSEPSRGLAFALAGFLGGGAFIYYIIHPSRVKLSRVRKMVGLDSADTGMEVRKLSTREKRFLKFSSVEWDGQIYMTPQDFLESVIEAEPKPRLKRRKLADRDISALRDFTPDMAANSDSLFRTLGNRGIISYTEYLFLLTILIKPSSGFKIAFSMLDQDGNERIDKEEFKVLEAIFSAAAKDRKENSDVEEDDFGLQKEHHATIDTSLLIHFFGKSGGEELQFSEFCLFMENLQTEVLYMEFGEFSKGAPTISELDFARILLRYTFLNSEDYDTILERLCERLPEEMGVTFEEFKNFCMFLNNLDDFQIAMKMYTLADKPISQDEFSRAVHICTGKKLSPHMVHTVFQIFDDDGDGLLSYQEFVAMMKDRIHRGLKTYSRQEGWAGFKQCVKQEMRAAT